MTPSPSAPPIVALQDRALIRVAGPDWRAFLQGLITQDVETITAGEVRYGALLTPQGRLLYDLFVWADADGATLDVDAAGRDTLVSRLTMYRLRAKVEIKPLPGAVWAAPPGEPPAVEADTPWLPDPRLAELGWRALGASTPEGQASDRDAYEALRLKLGVGDLARDGLADKAYAVEANLDLLHGVDFKKGCFVGQETTSRMKRRGVVKTRLVPLALEGEASPPAGSEVLAGTLRAGEVCASRPGLALALMRLDRAHEAALTVDGAPARLAPPAWLEPTLATAQAASGATP